MPPSLHGAAAILNDAKLALHSSGGTLAAPLGHLAFVSSFAQAFLYSSAIIRRICRAKISDDLSFFPYCVTAFASSAWLAYAHLHANPTLITTYSVLLPINLLILCVFWRYATAGSPHRRLLVASACVFAAPPILLLLVSHAWHGRERREAGEMGVAWRLLAQFFATYAPLISTISYASPLSAMCDVLKRKSTSSMSFVLSITNLWVSFVWLCFGWTISDLSILCCNAFGLVFSIVQIFLFAIYPSSSSDSLPMSVASSSSSKKHRVITHHPRHRQ